MGEVEASLLHSEVHVWVGSLRKPKAAVESLSALLSEQELERSRSFYFEHLRERSVLSYAYARLIISRYAGVPPQDLRFGRGVRGKPFLLAPADLHFNISHSEELFACGVTRRCALGVDVESVRPLRDAGAIAARYFTEGEAREVLARAGDELHRAFFRCWTRKEAVIKATGEGLYRDLHSFEVSVDGRPLSPLLLLDGVEAPGWEVHSFTPAHGYVGAVALPASGLSATLRRVEDEIL